MKNNFYFLLIISVLLSCKKNHQIELQFLDEYIVKDSLVINNTLIGGLSGLDYAEGYYYCVVDDQKKPRFLKVKIDINHNEMSSINFESVSFLKDTTTSFFTENVMDLEAIFFDEATREINFVSEGSINSNKSPSVFSIDENGKLVHVYELPKSLKNKQLISEKLSLIISKPEKEIFNLLNENKAFVWLKRNISSNFSSAISSEKSSGFLKKVYLAANELATTSYTDS